MSPCVRPICFPRLYVHHRPCTLQSINFNIWFSDLSVLSITILVGCEGVFGEGRLSDVLRPTYFEKMSFVLFHHSHDLILSIFEIKRCLRFFFVFRAALRRTGKGNKTVTSERFTVKPV